MASLLGINGQSYFSDLHNRLGLAAGGMMIAMHYGLINFTWVMWQDLTFTAFVLAG
jgi:hypothetical protein